MNRSIIRILDIVFSSIGLIVLLPLQLVIAAWIKWDSGGPVFFRQERIGKNGIPFVLFKYRSMFINSTEKGLLTIGEDQRITKAGKFLRRSKLDELPQLINVLLGQMSLVGQRPEVKRYVELYTQQQRIILSVRPGLTDIASIQFHNESDLLKKHRDPEDYYRNFLIPEKIRLNMIFIESPSIRLYFRIIFLTLEKGLPAIRYLRCGHLSLNNFFSSTVFHYI